MNLKSENLKFFSAPCEITVNANVAHLLTAVTDSIFIEFFDGDYSAINYPSYRKLIQKQLETN